MNPTGSKRCHCDACVALRARRAIAPDSCLGCTDNRKCRAVEGCSLDREAKKSPETMRVIYPLGAVVEYKVNEIKTEESPGFQPMIRLPVNFIEDATRGVKHQSEERPDLIKGHDHASELDGVQHSGIEPTPLPPAEYRVPCGKVDKADGSAHVCADCEQGHECWPSSRPSRLRPILQAISATLAGFIVTAITPVAAVAWFAFSSLRAFFGLFYHIGRYACDKEYRDGDDGRPWVMNISYGSPVDPGGILICGWLIIILLSPLLIHLFIIDLSCK